MIRVGRKRVTYVNPEPPNLSTTLPIFLHSKPGRGTPDQFYCNISNDISRGGIFVSTYDLKPLGSQARVTIHLPDIAPIEITGTVEWIREHNSDAPELAPGMGIAFSSLARQDRLVIDQFIQKNATLLFDTEEIEQIPTVESRLDDVQKTLALAQTALSRPDAEWEGEPKPDPVYEDNATERQFALGIFRDIEHLKVAAKPSKHKESQTPILRRDSASRGDCATSQGSHDKILARTVPQVSTQFQGGFSESDRGRGIFIASLNPRPIGTQVELRIDLGHIRVSASGKVVWIRRCKMGIQSLAAPSGMGVVLVNISRQTEHHISSATPRGSGFLSCEETSSIA